MKKILYTLIALVAIFASQFAVAQSRTSYHMEGSYFRNDLNPALAPTRGYLALPGMSGVGIHAGSNFLSVDNFIYQHDGGLVTALHGSVSADEFLKRLPENLNMNLRESVNILGIGFYSGKMYWTFGLNQRLSGDFTLSKDLFRAVKTLGNGVYDMGNAQLTATGYLDAYLGTSFRVTKWVNIGVKAKFLVGLANVNASFSQLALNVGEDGVRGDLNGQWYGNAVVFDQNKMKGKTNPGFADLMNLNPWAMLGKARSFGAAIDLGAEVRLFSNHLKISAAVTDLGFIRWKSQTYANGEINGNFYFNGVDFESGEIDADGGIDLDRLIGDCTPTQYTSRLNFNINAGVEYNFLRNHFAVGVLSHTEFFNDSYLTELTASFNIRPVNWITLTASHTFFNKNRPGVFGAAINIHPSALNIYVAADFIDPNFVVGPELEMLGGKPLLLSRYAKSLNLYAGVAFNFGRPKFLREGDKVKVKVKSKNKSKSKSRSKSRSKSNCKCCE